MAINHVWAVIFIFSLISLFFFGNQFRHLSSNVKRAKETEEEEKGAIDEQIHWNFVQTCLNFIEKKAWPLAWQRTYRSLLHLIWFLLFHHHLLKCNSKLFIHKLIAVWSFICHVFENEAIVDNETNRLQHHHFDQNDDNSRVLSHKYLSFCG